MKNIVFALALTGFIGFTGAANAQEYASHIIKSQDRAILREYMAREQDKYCDRSNENTKVRSVEPCASLPSRVVSYYPVGQVLPQSKIYETLPQYVESRLTPVDSSSAYVYTGDNVYLIDAMTHRVLDVVSLAAE